MVTDRAQGVASLADGQLEVLLHLTPILTLSLSLSLTLTLFMSLTLTPTLPRYCCTDGCFATTAEEWASRWTSRSATPITLTVLVSRLLAVTSSL